MSKKSFLTSSNLQFTSYTKTSIILRLIAGPTVFLNPILAIIFNIILDAFDGELFKRSGYDRPQYSMYDKILDYYWYIWVLIFVLATHAPAPVIFIGLFAHRTLGQLLFLNLKNGLLLFFFPNIFEKFFFLYVAVTTFGLPTHMMEFPYVLYALILLIGAAITQEYIVHMKKMNLSGVYLGKTSYWPTKTINPYKAFIVVSLVFTLSVLLQQFVSTTSQRNIPLKATKATKNGRILSYDATGKITGTIRVPFTFPATLYLSPTSDFSTIKCKISSITHTTLMSQKDAKATTFNATSACLTRLGDGTYYALIESQTAAQEPPIMLQFTLRNGILVQ